MAYSLVIFGLMLLTVPAFSKPISEETSFNPHSQSAHSVLLPNGEIIDDLNLTELKETLDEHYSDLTNDPELLERIDTVFDKIVDEMMESEEMKLLPQAEKEQRLVDVILKMKDESIAIYKEFFRERTGKDIIT